MMGFGSWRTWTGVVVAAVAIVAAAALGKHTVNPDSLPAGAEPPPCAASTETNPHTVLVLTASLQIPTTVAHVGDVIELSFPDWQSMRLRVPTQKPALTCSLGPMPGGPTSTLLVRALAPGTVHFSTTVAGYSGHVAMPAVSGTLVIDGPTGSSSTS